ncbi:response regulator transcription factor [Oceanicella sp. SM1341]|uniref:response regulator transcription factor n=1 Tax=Oceanicella sp. SM1341 TaxID=1548889 RepID=UPI000E54C3D0|nr:response regulator transcription factor [Oceanicella sp. SM1341]
MKIDSPFQRKSAPQYSPPAQEDGPAAPVVMIVDDDACLREALAELLMSVGFEVACFASTAELLASATLGRPGCLILDVRMPGTSGLDLQRELARRGEEKSIIFLTGHGDIPMSVQAMKAGAIDFLTKPVRDQTLLDAVSTGIATDAARRREAALLQATVERFRALTPREREVFCEVARGRLNKQIAYDLGISEVTVKLHRANVMRKMEVAGVGGLIRAWTVLPEALREQPAP